MTSVFDLFRPAAKPAEPATAAVTNAATNPTVPNATNSPVPVANADGTSTGNPTPSPLDNYADLWKNDPNAKPSEPFSINSDPTKLLETAKGVDFVKLVSPDVMKRIQAGGADAQQAMLEAMNATVQNVFAQSAHASAKITESALRAQEERFKDLLPALIKQHSVSDLVRTDNPLMNDPAMAPVIEALQQQFTKQYPKSTPSDIKQHVSSFLDGAADRITSLRPQKVSANKRQDMDWSKFLE